MKEKKDAESEMFKDDKYMGVTQEDMDKAASIGGFPHRPTDLFLKVSFSCCHFEIETGELGRSQSRTDNSGIRYTLKL